MSLLRWTTKSTRKPADELTRQGHRIGADTVGDLLREESFSLQGNAKILEGKQHPDRDAQFRYLNDHARHHQDCGQPVISVDTKKKELVGPFKNHGREWEPKGEPVMSRCLRHPELTGMSERQLGELIDTLIPELELQHEQTLRTRRGHERLVAPGTGAKANLTPTDRILATVLHLRKLATVHLLGELFGVAAATISRANQEVRPLLEAHGHHINASTVRFCTPADVSALLTSAPAQTKIKKTT